MVGKLLPIHVRECRKELDGLLGPIVYIDIVGVNEDEARQRLLYGVKRGRQVPNDYRDVARLRSTLASNKAHTEGRGTRSLC